MFRTTLLAAATAAISSASHLSAEYYDDGLTDPTLDELETNFELLAVHDNEKITVDNVMPEIANCVLHYDTFTDEE